MMSGIGVHSVAMPSFAAAAQIAASPARVWDTLTNTSHWTQWDPSLESVEGTFGPGGRLVIRVRGTSRPFKLKVAAWEPGRRAVLVGGMPLGLFTGTRTYELTAVAGGVRFEMAERYSGPLAGLIGRSIPDLQPSFDSFVAGLRTAAER